MISVIVPVYNVEAYLPKCLDSIVGQTYKDLEILLIDDGSTDRGGEICDRYAQKDPRIRVFHTENHGLAAARNLGLDHAAGSYIAFVDSDDWIEPDMYETLFARAEKTGADVAACGCFLEYAGAVEEIKRSERTMSGTEAVQALLHDEVGTAVWTKLWSARCFENIRFPTGRIYEDTAVVYKLFASSNKICIIEKSMYHYLQREGSLSKVHDMANLTGLWLSNRERYDDLYDLADDTVNQKLLYSCSHSGALTWCFYY